MTGTVNPPDVGPREPAPWWALNGYGMLVGMLEVLLGIAGLLEGPDNLFDAGYRVGLTVAGAGLLYGYLRRRVDIEVYASVLVVVVNATDFIAEILTTHTPAIDVRGALIQVIIVVGVSVRIWALTRGGVVTIPVWRRR